MRQIGLNFDQQIGSLIDNLQASSKLVFPDLMQNETLRLAVTEVVRNDPDALEYYTVEPWSFTEIRASVGLIDAAPDEGKFALRVTAGTSGATGDTALITYPTATDDATLTAFRADVIAKINAVAGASAAEIDQPDATPANFLYITWTNPADDRGIELISVALIPPIDTSQAIKVMQVSPKQTLVKLIQLPIVEVNEFAFPAAPVPEILPDTDGGPGINEVQILSIPAQALGAFDLAWNGAHTIPLAVADVTADDIAAALNAIVPTASFTVELRATRRFAISFTGPLAAADQPLLVVTPRDQVPLLAASGVMPLTSTRFERALNGAPSVPLKFELVITDAGGESKVIVLFNLINDMTAPGTAGSAAEQGAVMTITQQVNIPPDGLTPFATVAPGASYAPAIAIAANTVISITTGFSTWWPSVRVFYRTGVAPDPEAWRPMVQDAEFGFTIPDALHVNLTFTFAITDTGDVTAIYDKSRIKVFIASPDAVVEIFGNVKIAWDNVLASLPDGQSLTDAIASLKAEIVTLAGGLKIGPTSIDVPALTAAILAEILSDPVTKQQFTDLLTSVVADEEIIGAILSTITSDSTLLQAFVNLLTTTFANDTMISALVTALFKNTTFNSEFRKLVIEAFQDGGNLPAGLVIFSFDDWELIQPPPHQRAGPSKPTITGTVSQTQTTVTTNDDGSTTNSTQQTTPTVANVSGVVQEFQLLPCEIVGAIADATIAGPSIQLSDITDGHTRTTSAKVKVVTIGGRRGLDFPSGTVLGRRNGIIFPVRVDGGNAWPCEMEMPFFPVQLDDGSLDLDSSFALNFVLQLQLQGGPQGRIEFVIETGTYSHEGGETRDINVFTWAEAFARECHLTQALCMTSIAIEVTRQTSVSLGAFTADPATDFITRIAHGLANGAKVRVASSLTLPAVLVADTDYFVRDKTTDTFKVEPTIGGGAIDLTTAGTGALILYARDVRTGTVTLHGKTTTVFVVPTLPFAMRCWLKRFDCENITPGAKGALVARVNNPSASIAAI